MVKIINSETLLTSPSCDQFRLHFLTHHLVSAERFADLGPHQTFPAGIKYTEKTG